MVAHSPGLAGACSNRLGCPGSDPVRSTVGHPAFDTRHRPGYLDGGGDGDPFPFTGGRGALPGV